MIAIDPELGRIQFAADVPLPRVLLVSYWYGFPAAIGGGPYDRTLSLSQLDARGLAVSSPSSARPNTRPWKARSRPGTSSPGVAIRRSSSCPDLTRSRSTLTGTTAVQLPAGSSLAIVAGTPARTAGPRDVSWNNSLRHARPATSR